MYKCAELTSRSDGCLRGVLCYYGFGLGCLVTERLSQRSPVTIAPAGNTITGQNSTNNMNADVIFIFLSQCQFLNCHGYVIGVT